MSLELRCAATAIDRLPHSGPQSAVHVALTGSLFSGGCGGYLPAVAPNGRKPRKRACCKKVVMILAMTGKGGVGKTTLSALVINWLVEQGETPILAVDADSNANLHEALGIDLRSTIGGIREDAREEAQSLKGISKQEFLELRVQESLIERKRIRLNRHGPP